MMDPGLERAFARMLSLAVHVNSNRYCPLDELCCIIQKCEDLERLVVFADGIESSMANMTGRYDLSVKFPKELNFPRLKEYICKIDNQAYPFLMKREFCLKIASGLSSSKALEVCWDESDGASLFLSNKFPQLRTVYCNEVGLNSCENLENLTFLRVMDLANFKILPVTGIKRLAIFNTFFSNGIDLFEILENKSDANVEKLEEFSILSSYKRPYGYLPFSRCLTPAKKLEGFMGFRNLRKLSVPVCIFLQSKETDSNKAEGSVSKKTNNEDTNSFEELTKNVSNTLEHLELHVCGNHTGDCCGEVVLEQIEKLPKLRILVLGRFKVNVGISKNIFSKIFRSCSLLEDLKIYLWGWFSLIFCRLRPPLENCMQA